MRALLTLLLIGAMLSSVEAQNDTAGFRPPAVPLVTCDPYFSIWSFANHPAMHLTGVHVLPTRTVYEFLDAGVELTLHDSSPP